MTAARIIPGEGCGVDPTVWPRWLAFFTPHWCSEHYETTNGMVAHYCRCGKRWDLPL